MSDRYSCTNDKCANYSITFEWDNADPFVACRQCGEIMTVAGGPVKKAAK